MSNFRFKSLMMRIWVIFMVVILLITLCLSVAYLYIFRFMDTKIKTQDLLDAHTYTLQSDFIDPMQFDVFRNLRSTSHFIYANGYIYDVMLTPMDERPAYAPPPNMGNGEPKIPKFDNFAVRNWLLGFAVGDLHEKTFHEKFSGINFIFVISLLEDGSYYISYIPNAYDNSIVFYMLAISCLFIIVGLVAAKIIANSIAKPLSQLENFTMRIAAKDWKEPIDLKNEDEIGRLAVSMNKMQEALKRADEEEKSFLQSISHDLKTPVMVIMGHADAIMDGVYIETLDKTAQIIKDEAINLNKKIKQLLYFNTLDYMLGNQPPTTVIKLDEVLGHIVERFRVLGSHLTWNLDIQPVAIKGNEEKLIVAIENVFDNALRYAETEISLVVKKSKKTVRVEVFNDGAPIRAEDLEKVFHSLYKDKIGNFGLGLAITKKIITFFGGSIRAENSANGVSFIIDYPLP